MAVPVEVRQVDDDLVRAMTAERKLDVMRSLIQQAFDLKAAWIRMARPALAEDEVWELVRRQVTGGSP